MSVEREDYRPAASARGTARWGAVAGTGARLDASTVAAALAERMGPLSLDLLGHPTSRGRFEWRWGRKGSLGVHVAGPKRGRFYDNDASIYSDALGLVQMVQGSSFRNALDWALGWLGSSESARLASDALKLSRPAEATLDTDRDKRGSFALHLWSKASEASGSPVETYLRGRGLKLPPDAPLRFHPACPRGADRLPAMLALMTDSMTGEACGVHRTFLAPGGDGKAKGQAKMMLGQAGIIRLVPDMEVCSGLGLAEGIETALAVMQKWGWRPVWAAASAGGIERFPILPGIEALTIYADRDESGGGIRAARACAERWTSAGREVRTMAPPEFGDFADLAGRAA